MLQSIPVFLHIPPVLAGPSYVVTTGAQEQHFESTTTNLDTRLIIAENNSQIGDLDSINVTKDLSMDCPDCVKIFSQYPNLKNILVCCHKVDESIPVNSYKCDICKKAFKYPTGLKSHLMTHSVERPFKCGLCEKSFKWKNQVKEHLRVHTGEKKYACDECGYATANKTILHYHKNRHHKRVLEFVCEICGKLFPTPHELKTHLTTHKDKKFKCNECGKAFHAKHNLVAHQEGHNPNRSKFQCEFCGKKYSQNSGLKKHIVSGHLKQKKKLYQCEFCEKTVTSLDSLKIHRRKHTGDKPFSCDGCEKSFGSKNVLIAHKRVHTGEKPFTCHLCNKSFSQRGTLTIHHRSHSGVKPYECAKCSKAFVTKTLMKTHMKSHA